MREVDVAVVGAGAAGLSLTHRLAAANAASGHPLTIALLEPPPGPGTPPERTWCFWERGPGPWDPIVAARWEHLEVVEPDGTRHRASAEPLTYKMLRSRDVDRHVRGALREREQLTATVTAIEDGPERAVLRMRDPAGAESELAARWVFDSRPLARAPADATALLQHFRGWFVRTSGDAFTPDTACLMDLRTPQPRRGVSFGYLLPLSAREALVEYTEFTRAALDDAGYTAALRDYTGRCLDLGPFTVTAVEQGAIPMTDGRWHTRAGRRVFRIGTSGGATRPATGYTFSGIQRQATAITTALHHGRTPVPPVPHRPRHLAMDAVLLRALDTGRLDGADFFARLFRRNGLPGVLDFLDGRSGLTRELALGATTPVGPMALTTLEHAWRRGLRRRRG
ncbi:lycopene cyclase family protein [Marinitenerispora sediminis]|uniref:Lycopene cyclase n=1 Tax=Marinitenerispora sediminis TaxID=1931232 RepID=A0A368T011_9ACTN|nr:lycopene cyclase family protein [Marinitenerispora sediminis]RCV52029.1 lycopene cyclase [Marinitenerispora sediminis]RCV55756.1 lycopene cyclase [Marinitenerispora sediminis]RCV57086.1 lycopene cyclase [Marinitenerispora sediminis]